MAKEVPEEIRVLLKTVVDHFDKEDSAIRERQIRTWRKLKLLWEGFQQTWYSEVAHDWRIWDDVSGDDTDQAAYDKPINVFRAYLESIIAALSVTVPPVKCYPDDADNTLDLATARAGDKIAQLIYRHNDVSLLWVHALFIYCTEGMVACYNYPKADEKFGTYEEKEHEDETKTVQSVTCPNCGHVIDETELTPELMEIKAKLELEKDKFQPGPEDVNIQDTIQSEQCPNCLTFIAPEIQEETFVTTRLVGVTDQPKSRMMLEAYGGLYIKVASYAKKQEDTPYLMYAYETHFSNAIERFEHLHNDLNQKIRSAAGPSSEYEQWGRLSPQYRGEYPENNVTIKNTWLRPSAFNILKEDDTKKLKKLFPNGVKVVHVNDMFGEACNESLDDHWTLTYNPLSDFIHHDPLGLLLVSIQEITNDLISLTLQTIEHGIPQTFADPAVLNFNAYRQMESTPGGIYEATPKSGKGLGDGFHEVKTAALSPEVMPFSNNIQSLAQLVSGALPSLFGGNMEGSETASQYSMSRAQALQRLQNTWKIFTVWWKQIFGKTIPQFIEETKDDERDVQQDKDGNFINVFIRKAELEGKIGKVELEANENLPLTWSQRKDVWMKLMEIQNPQILALLSAPENLPIMREALGLTDLFIPGEDDKDKQYDEIKLLLNSEPMQTGDMMMPEMPSVEIDPDYDNHQIQFEICRKWIISEAGRQAKTDNEAGYHNVLLHGKMHLMQMQQAMMAQVPQEDGAPSEDIPPNLETPIQNESDIQTIQ